MIARWRIPRDACNEQAHYADRIVSHRILVLNGPLSPPFGGIATLLDHLLPVLAEAGHEVHTLMGPRHGQREDFASAIARGVHVHFGSDSRWRRAWAAARATGAWWGWWRRSGLALRRFARVLAPAAVWLPVAERLVRDRRIDIVHAYDTPWNQGLIAAYLKARYGCRFVFTNFGELLPHAGELQHHDPDAEPLAPLVRAVLESADRIFSVSWHCAREVAHVGFPADRVGCIYGGIDVDAFIPVEPDPATRALLGDGDGPRILFLGQVRERKGPDTLVESMAHVHAVVPAARCAIVGPDHGIAGRLRERIDALGLAGVVRVTGPIPGPVVRIYNACDVFVFPSRTNIECLGLSAIQAMACGRAVVATRIGGVPEVVHDGETGLLVPPGDPVALAAVLTALCADPALRHRLGTAARADALARFDRRQFAARVAAIYDEVASD